MWYKHSGDIHWHTEISIQSTKKGRNKLARGTRYWLGGGVYSYLATDKYVSTRIVSLIGMCNTASHL